MTGGGGGGAAMAGAQNIRSVPNAMTFTCIAIVMMGAAMFGADQSNFGISYGLTSFGQHWCPVFAESHPKDYLGVDCAAIAKLEDQPKSWNMFITWGLNLVTIGMMSGALIPGPLLASRLGRRWTISIGGLTCFVGCLLATFLAGKSVPVYYIGRFTTGFGCGVACYVLPMYNAEVSTLSIRGTTGSLFQFMVVFGGVVAILALSQITEWEQGFLIPGYFGLVVGVMAWGCPESPRFLMDRYGKESARSALERVRDGDVSEELDFMEECLQQERAAGSVSYADLFTKPGLRKRLFVACYLQAAQQLTGVNAFLGFQTDIFEAAGYAPEEITSLPGGPAFIVQMVFVVGCVTGLLLVDSKYGGRKCQLLSAAMFMGPPLILAACAHFVGASDRITAYCVFIFSFGFQMAWGIIPWFYPAELFKNNERERALSISTFCGFGFNVLVGMVTRALYNWSQGGMFLIFGILNITNVVFVAVMMRETKGVALEDIPAMFDGPDSNKVEPLDDNENEPSAALKNPLV